MRPLERMFWEELAEMLHVEEMLDKSLFKMHVAVFSTALKECLESYRGQTRGQALRIRRIFEVLDIPARERKCDTMIALLTRAQQMILRAGSGAALDAALLSLCARVNAYKCAAYETLLEWGQFTMTGHSAAQVALRQLGQTETNARASLQDITEEINEAAGEQVLDSPRSRPRNPSFSLAKAALKESLLE